MKTQVTIVGAGPTGLMLANQLQRYGVDFVIVDTKEKTTDQSRALAVSARSMELYQQLGLSDTIRQQSVDLLGFKIYADGKTKADVDLQNLGNGLSDFPNFMNAFEQSKNEQLLYENLRRQEQEVLWKHEFVRQQAREDGVQVVVKDLSSGKEKAITTKYLIGCDGASSPVRKSTNLTFEGGTYENKFFVADTTLEWDMEYDKVILVPTDKIFITFFPLKGRKRMRVIGTLPSQFSQKENIDFEELEAVIRQHTRLDFNITEVGWHSVYKLHHRCVNAFREGNVFLSGDSAHVHSPAGGQGMNTGLQDAHNLAWKMAWVLQGLAGEALLDTYNEERLPFAQGLLNSTDQGFTFLAGSDFWTKNIRKFVLIPGVSWLLKFAHFRQFAFKKVSQIDYNYRKRSLSQTATRLSLKFKVGDRLPYVRENYYEKFRQPCFHLIALGKQPANVSEEQLTEALSFPVKLITEKIDDHWKKWGVKNKLFILVRPDQYIATVADDIASVKQYINTHIRYSYVSEGKLTWPTQTVTDPTLVADRTTKTLVQPQ